VTNGLISGMAYILLKEGEFVVIKKRKNLQSSTERARMSVTGEAGWRGRAVVELTLYGASLILNIELQGERSPVWPLPIPYAAAKQPTSPA
jgi:hypothetical protein